MTTLDKKSDPTTEGPKLVQRRTFLKYAGLSAGAVALVMAGCKDKKDEPAPVNNGINLGSGDVGILNYAYALEQLEAAFYTTVVAHPNFATTFSSAAERQIMIDIRDHEVIHRDFFKAALGASAIQNLTPNFTSIDFNSRTSVLGTAKAFEDLGVSAYNGAGKLLADVKNLLVAGKIVSVEARHAAAIRDLINPKDAPLGFAGDDVVDPGARKGLDMARTPAQVLAIAGTYITEKLDASNLPTA